MSAFKADLIIENKAYPLRHCSFKYRQQTRADGRPATGVLGGSIELTLQDPAPKEIVLWVMDPADKKQGTVRFYEVNAMTGTHQLLAFSNAFCIEFGNTFIGESHATGVLISAFTLNAQLLSFDGVDFNQ